MKTIGAAQFKAQCLAILDDVGPEGIVITKRGKPVAKLVPIRRDPRELIGVYKDRPIRTDATDDLLSTGAWVSDERGDLNDGRGRAAAATIDGKDGREDHRRREV